MTSLRDAPHGTEALDLTALGIPATSLRLYLRLLENAGSTGRDGVVLTSGVGGADGGTGADSTGLPPAEAERALAALESAGLLRRTGADAWVPLDPGIGIERLIESRLTELNEDMRRVTAARGAIPELADSFRQGRSRDLPLDIEHLEGVEEVRSRLDDLAFFARTEVLALQPTFSPGLIEASRALDLRCLRRGVALRTLISRSAAEHPVTLSYLGEITALGAKVRFTDRALDRMVAYDRTLAVVPVDPDRSARGALVIRQPGVLAGMLRLFEELWQSAQDIGVLLADDDEDRPDELSDVEREVLRILCDVDKDEIGARRMGVSLRTFRRYVADVMLRLNAANRFHAAMLAKERGWI